MGTILKDKLEDFPSAMSVFNEYERRYANHENVPDAYFQQFMMMERTRNEAQASAFRSKILDEYPDSKYALMLQNPNFVEQQKRMFAEQDSLYSNTYAAYMRNDFRAVFTNNEYVKRNFPHSNLMPKFDFLSALSVGRTQSRDTFATKLDNLIATFPQADVTPMAKDILALVGQGRENIRGGSAGNLLTLREETLVADNKASSEAVAKNFSLEKIGKHRLMLNAVASKNAMNELLYQVAVYNFSRFMIKDFELIMTSIDSTHNILSITNLENFDEARWYEKSLAADTVIAPLFAELNITPVVISEDNYALLQSGIGLEKYLVFEKQIEQTPAVASDSKEKEFAENKLVTVSSSRSGNSSKNKTENETVDIKVLELPKEEKPVEELPKAEDKPQLAETQQSEQPEQANNEQTATDNPTTQQTPEQPQPATEMYKNLFVIEPNEPHIIALYVLNGKIDFEKTGADFDAYNAENYGLMNLEVSLDNVGGKEIVVIGAFPNAETAKSYLLRVVKEKSLFDGLKGVTYRNLVGTRQNIVKATTTTANLNVYLEFMKEYYLK
jgi:hypothetical protein